MVSMTAMAGIVSSSAVKLTQDSHLSGGERRDPPRRTPLLYLRGHDNKFFAAGLFRIERFDLGT